MVYKKNKKRKIYETWHQKLRCCDIFIYRLPSYKNELYHFNVECKDNNTNYSSLDETDPYSDFNEVCDAADRWVREHVDADKL